MTYESLKKLAQDALDTAKGVVGKAATSAAEGVRSVAPDSFDSAVKSATDTAATIAGRVTETATEAVETLRETHLGQSNVERANTLADSATSAGNRIARTARAASEAFNAEEPGIKTEEKPTPSSIVEKVLLSQLSKKKPGLESVAAASLKRAGAIGDTFNQSDKRQCARDRRRAVAARPLRNSRSASKGDDRNTEACFMIRRSIGRSAVLCLLAAGGLLPFQGLSVAPAASTGAGQATLAKECGACHMVFAPEFLPARSWIALMNGLANHFGEVATLDAATKQDITGYLVAHAGDASGGNSHFLRGLRASQTPLRITDTPY